MTINKNELPVFMEKCIRHAGGTKIFYYFRNGEQVYLIDPEDGEFTTVPLKHFKNSYIFYSDNLPEKIKEMFDKVPNYRTWKQQMREQNEA